MLREEGFGEELERVRTVWGDYKEGFEDPSRSRRIWRRFWRG